MFLLFRRDVLPKVLCIDDEHDLRQDIVEELQDAGYNVFEAANGQEGLQIILNDEPDLVVSDITMPLMNGYELLTELRTKHPKYDEMPFIFLSALADKDNVLKGIKAGSDDYITKPIDFDLLLAKVESRLRQNTRMLERKKKEQIHLYKAMKKRQMSQVESDKEDSQESEEATECHDQPNKETPDNSRQFVLVGRETKLIKELKNHLELNGDKVTSFSSGKAYLTKRKQFEADITFFGLKTDDVDFAHIFPRCKGQAGKMVFLTNSTEQNFVKFLFSKINPRELAGVLKLPCEHGVIDTQIANWMKS